MRAGRAWLVLLFAGAGCATAPRAGQSVRLRVQGRPGEVSVTRNLSVSRTRAYDEFQLLRDRREAVDFTARTRVVAVDDAGRVTSEVTTLNKDGQVPLLELAFPEPGESIPYLTAPDGTVLKAGPYPPDSLFFIPSLPLPKDEVRVGDTWSFDHEWRSGRGGLPMRLEVTGILKGLRPCLGRDTCADVEISGRVSLGARPNHAGTRFTSRVRGRALFSLERGEVRWSEMRSNEELINGHARSVIESCMVSRAAVGAAIPVVACEPGDDVEIHVPGL